MDCLKGLSWGLALVLGPVGLGLLGCARGAPKPAVERSPKELSPPPAVEPLPRQEQNTGLDLGKDEPEPEPEPKAPEGTVADTEKKPEEPKDEESEWIAAGGECAKEGLCVGIRVHLVQEKGRSVQDAKWWAEQIEFTQRLFAEVKVSVRTLSVEPLDARFADLRTPADRDALYKFAHGKEAVDVFVVRRLADIDRIGEEIRGVHWRRRSDIKHRWVIVSSIAMPGLLAHELGHFFGLPHSRYKISIMNKRRAPGRPPFAERVFAAPELKIMAARRDEMRRSGRLVDQRGR